MDRNFHTPGGKRRRVIGRPRSQSWASEISIVVTCICDSGILETKGFDDLAEMKAAAARRWVAAVNADGQFGRWQYEMARAIPKVRVFLDQFL
jgi:hypothetical protein